MSKLQVRIFDGSREHFPVPQKGFLIRVIDGNQQTHFSDFYDANEITFSGLPFFDNFGDNYTVLVSADGYKDAGFFPVKISDKFTQVLDVMLVSNTPGFSFADAGWNAAKTKYPFLAADVSDAAGKMRYEDLLEEEKPLACLLNLSEATGDISLSQGTPLAYIKQLRWDDGFQPAQDRFFSWCDLDLINQVRIGASVNQFFEQPVVLHPGATHSWKEVRFGEANVQLTFHENDKKKIGGVSCVMLEVDMDYFRDPLAHIFLEVLPNGLTHSLTNPVEVYVLRWMAGQMSKIPEFTPMYTVTG